MANRAPMEFSPFLGPDSLRQFLYLSKKLFENHTPRTYGFEDTKGSYYEGTVENWGSEELMESRKLLLNKPSLKNILVENTFDYYFNVQYSGFVNTYDQQSLLCALLRKDVLLSNHTYKLRFDNAYEFSVPRAASSSDPIVKKDRFVVTLTPPTLVIDGNTSVTLKLTDVTGATTAYYFHMGVETEDLIDTFEDHILTTKEIDDSMNGYPMIWMSVDVLKTLPDIRFEGNEYGEDEKPLLTIGTDGHDISLVYPFLSLTSEEIELDNLLIKVLPSDTGSFTVDPSYYEANFAVDVYEVHFCFYSGEIDVHERPDRELVILYDNENSRLTLHQERFLYWEFREPVQGDYDYDGTTYRNRIYAYIYATSFSNNLYYDDDIVPRPCFELHMAEEYAYPTEYLSLNAYSGIHVDVTSDHSDNDVSKKNGVIHDLGDYDGLPPYFKYDEKLIADGKMMNKKIHRAHVEMYALRDKYNDPYQKATDKPTAAVIVDSGIPQIEYDELTDGLPLTIVFDREDPDNRHFYWDPEQPPVSRVNILSEINYVDMYHLGNAKIVSQVSRPKLIYHGNRHFSLYKIGFDPELEFGRVFLITNDKAEYENNDNSDHPKAPTTFARICDIPTAYSHITSIENESPTFVLDTDYVRTESNYTHDDIDRLVNERGMEHVIHNGNRYVFDYYTSPSNFKTLAESEFPAWKQLVSVIDLNSQMVTFNFDAGGAINYQEGDLFDFYVGGICIKGKVEEIDNNTIVKVSYMNQITGSYYEDRPVFFGDFGTINRGMFDTYQTSYPTNAKSGSGEGLHIVITIDETYFNTLHRTSDGIIDGVYYFFNDDYSNISVFEYNKTADEFENAGQVTGLIEYKNKYDTARSRKYTILDTFLYSKMTGNAMVLGTPTVDPWDFFSRNIYNDAEHAPEGEPYLDPTGMTDMSVYLNDDIINVQDTFYLLKPSYGAVSDYHAMITRFSNNAFTDDSRYTNIEYPDFGDLNLSKYYMKSNVIKYTFGDDGYTATIYDPNKSTKKTTRNVSNDVSVVVDEKDITIKDVLIASRFTPQDIFDSQGRLGYNIYSYNEFDTSYRDTLRHTLSEKDRNELIDIITAMNEAAYPLNFEDTGFAFTKDMLIEYIIDNDLFQGPDSVYYTEGPESIYRRQGVKLFAYKGSKGTTPTGGFIDVIEEIYPTRKIGNTDYEINPEYIFRLDDVTDPMTLGGFRMYDGDINITEMTMLIINSERYIARFINGGVVWVKIQRRND